MCAPNERGAAKAAPRSTSVVWIGASQGWTTNQTSPTFCPVASPGTSSRIQ